MPTNALSGVFPYHSGTLLWLQALSWYQKAQQAAADNPEYTAKVKALSKSINRSKQIASKVENSKVGR